MARVRASDVPEKKPERLVIPHDAANECHVVGVAASDPTVLSSLAKKLVPDNFIARENREAWVALTELNRKKIDVNFASIEIVASNAVANYVMNLAEIATSSTSRHNLEWHIQTLLWDAARVRAATNTLPAFIEALRDPRAEPARVQSLARSIGATMDGFGGKSHILQPEELVRSQMVEIEKRLAGHAAYSTGIPSLDFHEPDRVTGKQRRRLVPGFAPKMVTVMTAVSGHGKTTLTARCVLGMAHEGRRVLYGAWEMNAGISIELMACLDLNWSRSQLMSGEGPIATKDGKEEFVAKMVELSKKISFVENPFRRKSGEKKAFNARNLDMLQGYIEDSGCDVFVGDLWGRILAQTDPDEEQEALFRMQAMSDECCIHSILLAQQRSKDIEKRSDQRPTKEGIKGSGAWTEVADNIFGIYRPALAKNVIDDKVEVLILKQRHGLAPVAVEFDWNADRGSLANGRSIAYERPGEVSDLDADVNFITGKPKNNKGGRGKWG